MSGKSDVAADAAVRKPENKTARLQQETEEDRIEWPASVAEALQKALLAAAQHDGNAGFGAVEESRNSAVDDPDHQLYVTGHLGGDVDRLPSLVCEELQT